MPGLDLNHGIDLIIVALLGALVGACELISRYRDDPGRVLKRWPGIAYLAVNAAAAATALSLSRVFSWTFGVESSGETLRWTQVLAAGFGALALFRSSLFVVRAGQQDVAIGPSSALRVILDFADRETDRGQASYRADIVPRIMQPLSFEKAYVALPVCCLALMQNMPVEDQRALTMKVTEILHMPGLNDPTKALLLGLALVNVVGPDVLEDAVYALGDEIKRDVTG